RDFVFPLIIADEGEDLFLSFGKLHGVCSVEPRSNEHARGRFASRLFSTATRGPPGRSLRQKFTGCRRFAKAPRSPSSNPPRTPPTPFPVPRAVLAKSTTDAPSQKTP